MTIKLYQPSNGSEGCSFINEHCGPCTRFSETNGCPIQDKTMFFDINEKGYPKEWRYCPLTEQPICMKQTTVRVKRKKPQPKIPGQLTF